MHLRLVAVSFLAATEALVLPGAASRLDTNRTLALTLTLTPTSTPTLTLTLILILIPTLTRRGQSPCHEAAAEAPGPRSDVGVLHCADTYVVRPAASVRTESAGQLAPGRDNCTSAVRIPASGVPYVPRAVAHPRSSTTLPANYDVQRACELKIEVLLPLP